jgi:hypothetical protein
MFLMSTTPVENGFWISLMDYSMKNGVSLSTLRRYIKAGKIPYKSENGKYFIFSTTESPRTAEAEWMRASSDTLPLEPRVAKLETDLKVAQEEISELKMLVAIYEERLFQNLPPQL